MDTSSARFDLNTLRNFIRHHWQEFNLFLMLGTRVGLTYCLRLGI